MESTPAIAQNSYDTAYHLTNPGYVYDALGRTTAVPAVDTAGIGTNATVTDDLSVGPPTPSTTST